MTVESILLTVTRIETFSGDTALTRATGFYFSRDGRLHVITSRHVVLDEASGHRPDRITIELHVDADNLAETESHGLALYDAGGVAVWREATDSAGVVDVVAIPVEAESPMMRKAKFHAFTPESLPEPMDCVEVGASVRVIGFPLNFHDRLHHLPLMRHAIVASSYGLRFEGRGYFLTDSLLHRGGSGSPVVLRESERASGRGGFPWMLIGMHSARLETPERDVVEDERLNLFATWYPDVLMTLTELDESGEADR